MAGASTAMMVDWLLVFTRKQGKGKATAQLASFLILFFIQSRTLLSPWDDVIHNQSGSGLSHEPFRRPSETYSGL